MEDSPFEKSVIDENIELPHGELNPAPEVPPDNENKQEGGSEDATAPKEGTESNVTVPEISKPSFEVQPDAAHDLQGRAMAAVAPRR